MVGQKQAQVFDTPEAPNPALAGPAVWGDFGIDAICSFLAMLLLFVWGQFALWTGGLSGINWWICLGLSATGFLGCVISYGCPDMAWRTGLLSAITLLCFTVVGILGGHNLTNVLFLGLGYVAYPVGEPKVFISNDRASWEMLALASTAFMAAIYLDLISKYHDGFKSKKAPFSLGTVQALLIVSIVVVIFAQWALHYGPLHFASVFTIALLFTFSDIIVWKALKNSGDPEHKAISSESKGLLFLLDLPILIGLAAILLFYAKLWYMNGCPGIEPHSIKERQSLFDADLGSGAGCSDSYPFLAGAIAFQMIAFNAIYVVFQFGWHKEAE